MTTRWEYFRLADGWLARPVGVLGTVGCIGGIPWSAMLFDTEEQADTFVFAKNSTHDISTSEVTR